MQPAGLGGGPFECRTSTNAQMSLQSAKGRNTVDARFHGSLLSPLCEPDVALRPETSRLDSERSPSLAWPGLAPAELRGRSEQSQPDSEGAVHPPASKEHEEPPSGSQASLRRPQVLSSPPGACG